MNEKIYMIDNIKFYYKKVGEYFVARRGKFSAKGRDLYTACVKALYKEALRPDEKGGVVIIPKVKIKNGGNDEKL